MVGMYTLLKDYIRVRKKNKVKRKRNKKVKISVEESSYEHIGLNSKQATPNVPQKLDHRPPQYKFR